jgi:hypothetical protein
MFEIAHSRRYRDAIRAAHEARGEAVAALWTGLFSRRR